MADEFIELKDIEKDRRRKEFEEFGESVMGERTSKKSAGDFFGRMKRGFGRAKELAQQYKQRQAQRQFSKSLDREQAMERATIRAEKEARFAKLHTRRLQAQKQVYEAATARNAAKGRYLGETMRFPIDMSLGALGRPSQPQPMRTKVVYRTASKKKGKARQRTRYVQQPQKSLDQQMVDFMRR